MKPQTKATVERIVEVLKGFGAKEVYLFGSAATGQMHEGSDLDFAVAGLPPREFYRAVADAMLAAGEPIDVVDLDLVTPFTQYLREGNELVRVG